MKIGKSYKQSVINGEFDVIVIGSGIGGLGAAALLAKHAGKRVLVLERHYTAGGFTHAFFRPGYEWDVGVHYIGDVGPGRQLRKIFDDVTDGALDWAPMGAVYDRMVVGGDSYDFVAGREQFRDRMKDYFPGESSAIDGYLERVREAAGSAQMYFAEKLLPAPVAALAGGLMRRPFLRHAERTTHSVLASLTRNPRLQTVLAGQWGDCGLPPRQSSFAIHALIASHYFRGGYYPVGGATRIAQTIEPVIEKAGGMVVTNADVDQIVVIGGRAVGVRMADGREFQAPQIISNAGAAITVNRLLPKAVAARHKLTSRLNELEPSCAHVSLYLGFRQTAAELGLPRHNIWVYPEDDHDRNVSRALADPDGSPLPLVFVSFPSAKDPDFERRYPGRATVEVVTMMPYERFSRWEDEPWKNRGEDYAALKQKITGRLLEQLYQQLPQLRDKVDHCELSTPLSTRRFAGHPRGEIYGLAHTPDRFRAKWNRVRSPIRGLALTGADVTGCGVAGALQGAVLAASALSYRNLLGAINKTARARAITPA